MRTQIATNDRGQIVHRADRVLVVAMTLFAAVLTCPTGPACGDFVIGTPANLGPNINTSVGEVGPSISVDGLSLYFTSERSEGYGGRGDIWVATRPTVTAEWGPATNLGPVMNSAACETSPCISVDGLSLFFCDGHWGLAAPQRPGGYGNVDLWVSTRTTTAEPWGPPVNLGPQVNSPYWDGDPSLSADGLSLYFASDRPGGYGGGDLYVVTRATRDGAWGTPVNLGPIVNSSSSENGPGISADGRFLCFASARPGLLGGYFDIWMTQRKSPHGNWEPPIHLDPPISSSSIEGSARISPDGSTLYFSAMSRSGGIGYYDVWQALILPVVDFNTDGKVDLVDLVMLIDNWGSNKTLYDIGPAPWGDGKVDIEDLKVFMSYWEKEHPGK